MADKRFGLEGVERRQQAVADAQQPVPQPQDGFSRLGQILVNLPWVLLGIAFIIWWLNK